MISIVYNKWGVEATDGGNYKEGAPPPLTGTLPDLNKMLIIRKKFTAKIEIATLRSQ
jgi:hypothetical protein